jgi:hypothetical protein
MTFGELSERMDSAELLEWIAFDRIHVQPARFDTALICYCMSKLTGSKNVKLDDFLPEPYRPSPPPDPDVGSTIKAWAMARLKAQRGRTEST